MNYSTIIHSLLKFMTNAESLEGSPERPFTNARYSPEFIRNNGLAPELPVSCFAYVGTDLATPCFLRSKLGIDHCDCAVAQRSAGGDFDTADTQYAARAHTQQPGHNADQTYGQCLDAAAQAQEKTVEQIARERGLPVLQRLICQECHAKAANLMEQGKVEPIPQL